MTLADSKKSSDEDLPKNRAQAAAELYVSRSDKQVSPGSNPVSMGRRLDVDAVLKRSVRQVATE